MKLFVTTLTSILFTTMACASTGGCGHLNIKLVNNTMSDCLLQNSTTYNNAELVGKIPKVIASGETAHTFNIQQSYTSGPAIQLNYRCKDKSIVVTSRQNYCFLSAGDISGQIDSSEHITAKYNAAVGSFMSHLPGHITWKFS